MIKKVPHEIEFLDSNTSRIKVYGGWMVVTGNSKMMTSVFVPDSDHQWKVVKKPEEPQAEPAKPVFI